MKILSKKTIAGSKIFMIALLLSIFIRGCCFQSFKIGTSSMESALYNNEYLFIEKVTYGARLPITIFSLPFLQNKIPFSSIKSYFVSPQLPYRRVQGRTPRSGELLVFNNPAQKQLPIDKRERLLSRCIATAGDRIAFIGQDIVVNDSLMNYKHEKQCYRVVFNDYKPDYKFLKKHDIRWGKSIVEHFVYIFALDKKNAAKLDSSTEVSNISIIQTVVSSSDSTFSFLRELNQYNNQSVQPFVIPGKGYKIKLNKKNVHIYGRIIEEFEGVKLSQINGKYAINKKISDDYVFLMDYYFVANDNRIFTNDSRSWGLLPESHIIGKAGIIWFSKGKQNIRWERFFRSCK